MNHTPRGVNRVLLGLFGGLLMVLGAGTALLMFPAIARWWADASTSFGLSLQDLLARTTLDGQRDSWLWIVLAGAMLALVALMVAWVAAQGRGRSGTLAEDDEQDGDQAAGLITINGAVAEQALKAALQERTDLVNSAVTTYQFNGRPALKVKVFPRSGISAHEVAAEVTDLVKALDLVVGRQTPVLISISSGARTRFTRTERVR